MDRHTTSNTKVLELEATHSAGNNVNDNAHKILRLIIYISCIAGFVHNSYAIFKVFVSDPTIISTKVLKSSSRTLELPTILICNDTAFKTPNMKTDYAGYKNNTLSLDDFLVDIVFVKDLGQSIFDSKPKSIKENVKELSTAFYGTCFLIREKLQVIHRTPNM